MSAHLRNGRSGFTQAGSIQLVALGFCAALMVLLAIPLIEALMSPPLISGNSSADLASQPRAN